ncbi:glycine-rich cell wall structural protein-like [Culex quinquefasciatus]|nr:glycine-rich cell wall structural protein-like [Culex quinquefasciatus]
MMDRIPSLSIPGLSLSHPLSIPTSQALTNQSSHAALNSLNLHTQNLHGVASSVNALHGSHGIGGGGGGGGGSSGGSAGGGSSGGNVGSLGGISVSGAGSGGHVTTTAQAVAAAANLHQNVGGLLNGGANGNG